VRRNFKDKYGYVDLFESINEKTRRVIIQEEDNVQFHFLSKELPESKILDMFNITEVQEFETKALFNQKYDELNPVWFTKHSQAGDLVLVKTTISHLKKVFETKFDKEVKKLSRINGMKSEAILIKNNDSNEVFLKVRPLIKKHRKFFERNEDMLIRPYFEPTAPGTLCRNFYRTSQTISKSIPVLEDFIANQHEQFADRKKFLITEERDEKGIYWNIISKGTELKLELFGLDPSTYVQVGQKISCYYEETKFSPENEEEELSFDVEIYTQK
jgi:hypothetical protein